MDAREAQIVEKFLHWAIHVLPYITERNDAETLKKCAKNEAQITPELTELLYDRCGIGLTSCVTDLLQDMIKAAEQNEDISRFAYTVWLLHTGLRCC